MVRGYARNEGQTIAADLIEMYSLGRDIKVTINESLNLLIYA